MTIVMSYIIANLALSLYAAYRRPSSNYAYVDWPAWWVVVSALLTIPVGIVVAAITAWKAVKR